MLSFYLIAGGMALVSAVFIVRPLIVGRRDAPAQDTTDAQVFRDQLAEIERDLDRGTISAQEAEGARVEVSRRLLAASARSKASSALKPAPQGHSGLMAGIALMGAPALAAGLYLGVGAPGLEDQPLAERRNMTAVLGEAEPGPGRPSQEEMEAEMASSQPAGPQGGDPEYLALVAQLEETVANRPDDFNGHRLLANAQMQLGRWSEATKTYERAVELSDGQGDADLFGSQAEAYILAAGGYVSPKAERALAEALRLDPTLPVARYYAGLTLRQGGNLDAAIDVWQRLRADSDPGAPYLQWLDVLLSETIQARGGPQAGPSQAEIDAANDMTPEERMAMIEGMVSRLESRLMLEGGEPQDWGQLMSSLATLDRMDAAQDAYEMALMQYPDGPAAEALTNHAVSLGIIEGTAPRGPSAAEVQAAQDMDADDRQAMIRGMVGGLEERLTTEGGSAEEWFQLIRSYTVLGDMDEAARVYKLAEAELEANSDPARGWVKEQALVLGVNVQ